MSASSKTPASVGAAPWKADFLSHISKMEVPEFVFTSLQPTTEGADAATPYVPRARYCAFRGMWGELAADERNEAPLNERVFESDMLTFTTDVRMGKVPQVFASSRGRGDVSQSQGSGGGGPVEAVFWVKEAMTQWRFRGEAYVVGWDVEVLDGESSGVSTMKHRVGERMRVVREEGKKGWSWETELLAHYGNLSPGMRGSFKNPPPGTPISLPLTDRSLGLGQQVTGLNDEASKKNFRVVIIRPDEVEQVDLSVPDKARRFHFKFVGSDGGDIGEWDKEEVWP